MPLVVPSHVRWPAWLLAALALGPLVVGCTNRPEAAPDEPTILHSEPAPTTPLDTGSPPIGVTYYGSARDVLDQQCVSCHHTGGPGGFALDTYTSAGPMAGSIVAAVDAGLMPPWQPDPDCHPLVGERVLSDSDREVLRDWAESGAQEGPPDGRPPFVPTPYVLDDYTLSAAVPGFVPTLDQGDQHYCFLFDELTFDEVAFAQAHQVLAGSGAVHHARMYLLSPGLQRQYRALDAASPGVGFPCTEHDWQIEYGDDPSLVPPDPYPPNMDNVAEFFGSEELAEYPEGLARPISAGSSIGMEVHYAAVGGAPAPDFTEIRMRLTVAPPPNIVADHFLRNLDIDIPAGEPRVVVTRSWPYWGAEPLRFRRSGAHMHLLATAFLAETVAPDGSTSCLLSIPAWDIDHIGAYYYPDEDLAELQPGTRLQVNCIYDNSRENQPVIDGAQGDPVDVSYGVAALDEMCIFQAGAITPYLPPLPRGAKACLRVRDCGAACSGTNAEVATCKQRCAEQDPECATCFQNAALGCADACPTFALERDECFDDCDAGVKALGGSLTSCLEHQCPDVGDTYMGCVEGLVDGSVCPPASATCGL